MAPNPIDYFAIQNTIARYCIALDTKNFDLLVSDVFAPDVHASFPVLGTEPITSSTELASIIKTRSFETKNTYSIILSSNSSSD